MSKKTNSLFSYVPSSFIDHANDLLNKLNDIVVSLVTSFGSFHVVNLCGSIPRTKISTEDFHLKAPIIAFYADFAHCDYIWRNSASCLIYL